MTERDPIEGLLRALVEDLYAADAADTSASLQIAWHGFDAVRTAGRILAASRQDYAVVERYAQPILARAGETLQTAPSLPTEIEPRALDLTGEPRSVEDDVAGAMHRDVLDVAYALTMLLPAIAIPARDRADRKACREAARLAYGLAECYEGRIRLFAGSRDKSAGP